MQILGSSIGVLHFLHSFICFNFIPILGLLTYDISFIASIVDSNMEKHELVNLKVDFVQTLPKHIIPIEWSSRLSMSLIEIGCQDCETVSNI